MAEDDRTPPTKIRITGLQEAQLDSLQKIDEACAALYHQAGIGPEQVHPLSASEIAKLFRTHDLYVAEADSQVAGYLAWRDEPPKVGCLDVLNVAPEYQRFGVGSRLLRQMGEACGDKEIAYVVARCWERAGWAVAFLLAAGFSRLDDGELPEPVREWRDRLAASDALARPGQLVYWRAAAELGVRVLPGIPKPQ